MIIGHPIEIVPETGPQWGGQNRIGDAAMDVNTRMLRYRTKKRMLKQSHIAVLDFETDPFDAVTEQVIFPFLAVLYGSMFEPVIIWEEDHEKFIALVIGAIVQLPETYTIYAHNGGKFDFMFLIHKLRGFVSFKGRGIMAASIGNHELRDSFHIIPERLANYQKDKFDYALLYRDKRDAHRDAIIKYCLADCRYLFDIVETFVKEHGLKLSIGQAAMAAMRNAGYRVQKLSEHTDDYLRQYFFGGRVECLAGQGRFKGDFHLYDVNSMYPYVMANYEHPIGKDYIIRNGDPGPDTVFVRVECDNFGAFVCRTDLGETVTTVARGVFDPSIYEYRAALETGLIANVTIIHCVDCFQRSNFDKFVLPFYNRRKQTKQTMQGLIPGTAEYNEVKKEDIFLKLLLNNAYGKFAQNPRRFKESYITNLHERPAPEDDEGFGDLPFIENEEMGYAIWERLTDRWTFNNVGTAASITGAARSVLLRAICAADDPIYCDTDSILCSGLRDVSHDHSALGAWKLEDSFTEAIVVGKKSYACRNDEGVVKSRFKGAPGVSWDDFESMLGDRPVLKRNPAPTLSKRGDQHYLKRLISATAAPRNDLLHNRLRELSHVS